MSRALISVLLFGCSTPDFQQWGPEPMPLNYASTTPVDEGCDAYVFQEQTYDCDELDRCTETDLNYRLACCDCDAELCDADPNCGSTSPAPGP